MRWILANMEEARILLEATTYAGAFLILCRCCSSFPKQKNDKKLTIPWRGVDISRGVVDLPFAWTQAREGDTNCAGPFATSLEGEWKCNVVSSLSRQSLQHCSL